MTEELHEHRMEIVIISRVDHGYLRYAVEEALWAAAGEDGDAWIVYSEDEGPEDDQNSIQ